MVRSDAVVYDAPVRIALVSPYSFTYPGGVGWHVEALAEELIRHGHDVRLLAPFDPDDRLARIGHRGARPQPREKPDYLIPVGRTIGVPANGAVSNVTFAPSAVSAVSRELRHGDYDVVHVHEPNGAVVSCVATELSRTPIVATFHTYSTTFANRLAAEVIGMRRLYNKVHVRIAVSEAARWTAQRYCGGEYRVIPNGVDPAAAPAGPKPPSDELRLLFVGRAEERKGLPVLLRAFEALQGVGVRARLTVAGATPEEVEPFLLDVRGVDVLGRVTEEEKWRLLHEADLLCAPSLGGESFGMVLTEAFAAGTPVVASDIAGYRDVARDGVDGVLVAPGDPAAFGEALHDLAVDPERRAAMGVAARERAQRFAWDNVADEVVDAYRDAIAIAGATASEPQSLPRRVALRTGLANAGGGPAGRPMRLPSLEPSVPGDGRRRAWRLLRRGAVVGGAVGGVGLAVLALQRIGIESIGNALLGAQTFWVFFAFALMCGSMLLRAESWHAILRAALPGVRVRRRDAARGIMVGVLMSATLPARLGEPSRALIVARRLGRVRERLPVVLGTIVSQTLLNIVALVILGTVMFATIGLFHGHESALVVATILPVALLAIVLSMPALLRRGKPSRFVRVQQAAAKARAAMVQVRRGLEVFRRPKLGAWAAFMQITAWAVQWFACYALLVALGLDAQAGIGAAAAVLFAVNVTAALPATPSNIGVFQAACVAVLSVYHVGHTDALAYGIILQAVEIATAFTLGMPALVGEGMSWKDLRLRALHSAPVELGVGRRRSGLEQRQ
ncbi:MAG: phosphatidyl-myo-inositol alpha-mannosyltransferase [Thermoleophilaceae bacterium]|nr:phosphatidyl-myo-inositol alpha-mannosyltransferase [Thermoleophilaceae bacterium]